MARIRTIKPEFWANERNMNCSRDARLLFIGIWNFADDGGRIVDSARTLKAQIFPGDDDIDSTSVRRWLDELSTNKLIQQYEVEGKAFLYVTGWEHQKIDRPRPSKIPGPQFDERSTNDRRGLATDLTLSNPIQPNLTVGVEASLARSPNGAQRSSGGGAPLASSGLTKLVAEKWTGGRSL